MKTATLRLALFLSSSIALTAQRATWVVDANGGAGAQFTAIEPAVNAAADGDLIIVRAGLYKGFTVTRPLSIVGEQGAGFLPLSGNVTVVNLANGRDFLLTGFAWSGVATTPVTVHNCRGRVVLDRLVLTVNAANFGVPAIRLDSSAQVTISECTLFGGPGVSARDTQLTVQNCAVDGHPTYGYGPGFDAQPAIATLRSRLFVAASVLRGGKGSSSPARSPAAALVADASALTIGGTVATQLRAGDASPLPASSLTGADSTLVLDPDVTLLPFGGAPPISGTISVRSEVVPVLVGRAGGLGGSLRVELHTAPNQPFAILLGLPGDAVPIFDWGTLELDPTLPLVVVRSGTSDANGHFAQSLGVPNRPALRGTLLAWQALSLTGGTALRLSNAFVHGLN